MRHLRFRRLAAMMGAADFRTININSLEALVSFIPQVMAAHKMRHPRFQKLAAKMGRVAPPCMADDADWRTANGWLDETDVPESDASLHVAPMPDFTGESRH